MEGEWFWLLSLSIVCDFHIANQNFTDLRPGIIPPYYRQYTVLWKPKELSLVCKCKISRRMHGFQFQCRMVTKSKICATIMRQNYCQILQTLTFTYHIVSSAFHTNSECVYHGCVPYKGKFEVPYSMTLINEKDILLVFRIFTFCSHTRKNW